MAKPLKPSALKSGDAVRVLSLASPIKQDLLRQGCEELRRLGFQPQVNESAVLASAGTFAGTADVRLAALREGLVESRTRALFCTRGGYGSNYLLECLKPDVIPGAPKILLGASDISSLQIYLWEKFGWVSFYGPMVATTLSRGAGVANGYDRESLFAALTSTKQGWSVDLHGETLIAGDAPGVLLGGCLTLIETALATPWELQTEGAILVIEDRGMKPYAVDRSLMHLRQAGKFLGVTGIILGDFPDCESASGDETVRDVVRRVLGPLGIPTVYGVPVGHTSRPVLTLPLGVRARLVAPAEGKARIEILEPACT